MFNYFSDLLATDNNLDEFKKYNVDWLSVSEGYNPFYILNSIINNYYRYDVI